MRASAPLPSASPPAAAETGQSSAERAQALLDAAPPAYPLRERTRAGSVANALEDKDKQAEDAMDLDREEDEEEVAGSPASKRNSSSKPSPSPASPPPPPGSTRQLRSRSASATPGPPKKPSSAAAIAAASSSSASRARTGRRASTISDSSLTSLSDLDEEEEEEEEEEAEEEGGSEEDEEESGTETATPSDGRRDSIVRGLAREASGKKPSSSTAIEVVKAAKADNRKSRSTAGKGKVAAKGKGGKKSLAAAKGKGKKPSTSYKKKSSSAAGSSSSPVNGRFSFSSDGDEEMDDDLPAGDEAYDPSLEEDNADFDLDGDAEDDGDDEYDPSHPERSASSFYATPAFGGTRSRKAKAAAAGGGGGDKKGKGKAVSSPKAPLVPLATNTAKGRDGRRMSVAERARERARAMQMGPDGEIVLTSGALPGSSPPSKSTSRKTATSKKQQKKPPPPPLRPLPPPPYSAGPRLDTGFKPPPMSKVQELWERCEEVVLNARVEAGKDSNLQTRCEHSIENALNLLPAGAQQTALCLMMNRYSAFCGLPSVDIPVFPLTNAKLLLFLSRIPFTPLSRQILSRFPQPDPHESYALPLAGTFDQSLTTEEGRYVTQELVASWVDALAYAQMATRDVWEEVFDPVGGPQRKKEVGLDPARLLSSAGAGKEDGEGGIHPSLRKIQGDEAMKEILRAVESVESIRVWEEREIKRAMEEAEEARKEKGKGREVGVGGAMEDDGGPERKRTKWTKGGKTVQGPSPVGVRASSSTSNLSAQARLNGMASSPGPAFPALGSDVVTSTPQDPLPGSSASPSINGPVPYVNGNVWNVHPDSSFPRVDRFVPSSSSSGDPYRRGPSAAGLGAGYGTEAGPPYSRQGPPRSTSIIGGFGSVVAPLDGFNQRAPPSASSAQSRPFDPSGRQRQSVYAQPPPQPDGYHPIPTRRSSTSMLNPGVESLSFSPRGQGPSSTSYQNGWAEGRGTNGWGGGEARGGSYGSSYGYPPSRPSDRPSAAYDSPPHPSRSAMPQPPPPPSAPYDPLPNPYRQQRFDSSSFGSPAVAPVASTSGSAYQGQSLQPSAQQQLPPSYSSNGPGFSGPQPLSTTMGSAPAAPASFATQLQEETQKATAELGEPSGSGGATLPVRQQHQQEPTAATVPADQPAGGEQLQPPSSGVVLDTHEAPSEQQQLGYGAGEAELDPAQAALEALLESAEAAKMAKDAGRAASAAQEKADQDLAPRISKEPQSAPGSNPSYSPPEQPQREKQLLDAISSAIPAQGPSQPHPPAPVQDMPPPPLPSASNQFRSQPAYDPQHFGTSASPATYPQQLDQQRRYPGEPQSFRPHGRQFSAPAYFPQSGPLENGYGDFGLPNPSPYMQSGEYGQSQSYGYGSPSSSSAYPPRQPRQFSQQPPYHSFSLDDYSSQRMRQSTNAYSASMSHYPATEFDQPSHLPTPPIYQSRRFDPHGAPSAQNRYGGARTEYDHFSPRAQPVYARPPPSAAANTSMNGWPASSASLAVAGPSTSSTSAYATQAYPTPGTPADAQFAGPGMSGVGAGAGSQGGGGLNGYNFNEAAAQYSAGMDGEGLSNGVGLGIDMS